MGRRGRRPHPDILTPREWEVLDLLRGRLTNEQIAQRLGITLDGAKYHVSQILSKLGVGTREEAAAVAIEERRPWWARWPLWAKVAGAATAAAATAGLAVLVWGLIRPSETAEKPASLEVLTVGDLYARTREAASESGSVLHTNVNVEFRDASGDSEPAYTTEIWIDPRDNRIRSHFLAAEGWGSDDMADEVTSLILGSDLYYRDSDEPAEKQVLATEPSPCPGLDDPATKTLLCNHFFLLIEASDEPYASRIESDTRYDGKPAVALVLERSFVRQVRDGPPVPPPPPPATPSGPFREVVYEIVHRLYISRDDFLPLAWVAEFYADGVKGRDYVAEYDNEFVGRDDVPEGLFEPGSLGYAAEDTEARLEDLARLVTVYWLGEEAPLGSAGSLTLKRVVLGFSGGSSGELQYETPSGSHRISLALWQREPWEEHFAEVESGGFLSGDWLVERSELEIAGRKLVVYTIEISTIQAPVPAGGTVPPGASAPPAPKETFAYIDLDEIVVQLTTNRNGGPETVEELRTVVENLRRR